MIDLFLIIVRTVTALFVAVAAWFKTSAELRLETLPCDNNSARSGDQRRASADEGVPGFLGMDEARLARWDQVLMIVKPETVLA